MSEDLQDFTVEDFRALPNEDLNLISREVIDLLKRVQTVIDERKTKWGTWQDSATCPTIGCGYPRLFVSGNFVGSWPVCGDSFITDCPKCGKRFTIERRTTTEYRTKAEK